MGDCYLIAALISISKYDKFIENNLFVTKLMKNKYSLYCLKLYSDGIPIFVWVNSKFPLDKKENTN